MNSSDVIAIVAIIASAIVSITATLVSYYVNKENIQAKRSEMAFERRLDALREVLEQVGVVALEVVGVANDPSHQKQDDSSHFTYDFYRVYAKNLVFLPPSINKLIIEYGSLSGQILAGAYVNEQKDSLLKAITALEFQLTAEVQKFIGYT